MKYMSVALLVLCLLFFKRVWSVATSRAPLFSPLVVFMGMEALAAWPATIYFQFAGESDPLAAISAALGFASMIIAFVVAKEFLRVRNSQIASYKQAEVELDLSPKRVLLVVLVTAGGLWALSWYLYQGIPPALSLLVGAGQGRAYDEALSALASGRLELTKGYYFGGQYRGQGVVLQVLQIGWPFVTLLSWLMFEHTRKRVWLALSVLFVLASLVFIGGTGQRFQIIMLVVNLIIGLSLLRRFRARHIAWLLSAPLALVLLVAPLSTQNFGIGGKSNPALAMVEGVFNRIMLGNGVHTMEIYQFIAEGRLHFAGGRIHLEKVLTALPGVTVGTPFSRQLQVLRGGGAGTTFASMTNMGVLYADLGLLGIVMGYAVIGVLIACAHRWLFGIRKGILEVPLVAFIVASFADLPLSSLVSVSTQWAVAVAFYWMLRVGAGGDLRIIRPSPRAPDVAEGRRHL